MRTIVVVKERVEGRSDKDDVIGSLPGNGTRFQVLEWVPITGRLVFGFEGEELTGDEEHAMNAHPDVIEWRYGIADEASPSGYWWADFHADREGLEPILDARGRYVPC